MLPKEKWPTWSLFFVLLSKLLPTGLQKNDSPSSLCGLVRERESWPTDQLIRKNGAAVLKSSPIHKLWAVDNCSVGEGHTFYKESL